MRPEPLYPLFTPVTSLKGVGKRIGALMARLAGPNVVDLLWHLPSGLIDRRFSPKITDAPEGAVVTLDVTVGAHLPPRTKRLPYRISCFDDSGEISLVFFHAKPDYLAELLPEGAARVISGRLERYQGKPQMTHPDRVGLPRDRDKIATIEPVYPLTAGLTPRPLATAIAGALSLAPDLPEWNDGPWLARQGWDTWRNALRTAHAPKGAADLKPDHPARARLAYDELLANQLALLLVRAHQRRRPGRSIKGDGTVQARIRAALPFKLTGAQERSLREIAADMADETRMLRLLQGDVGSGKTVVALLAMARAVESGGQAALMAPTEILARQHFATIAPMAEAAGLKAVLLTGRDKGATRKTLLAGLQNGEIHIAIGTHALFQKDIAFANLALAVVDEQHRFGVHQRLALAGKGRAVDMLVMTATPIPRSLMMTSYGDLDASRLDEKPPGRKPVDTRAMPISRLDQVIARLDRAMGVGARAFWVCPLVEDSESIDLAAATDRAASLQARFGARVGLVHGRMKAAEKDAVIARFTAGDVQILVATTVIEVGVDVPEASIMVIEHAERFGLAQLHQLRGRVGRGNETASCLLLYQPPLTGTARARLKILRDTDDGFRIAEEDLRLRGAGELLGTRQSGLPEFRIADLNAHADLLAAAHDDARLIVARDPELKTPRGEALRTLLYLFEEDQAARTARSG